MKESVKLGRIAGLTISARPSAFAGAAILWAILSLVGHKLFKLNSEQAVIGGFIATLLHFLSDLWHHMGHARAAHTTNFPMSGVQYWGVIAASQYPENEGDLPAEVHIQRAVGGPIASAIMSLITGLLALLLYPVGGLVRFLSLFLFADNFFSFSIGALIPLGFTDGDTILHYWGKRQQGIAINGPNPSHE